MLGMWLEVPRCSSVLAKEWHHVVEACLKSEVEYLLTVVKTLKQRGLTGARMVHTFMHHRMMARQKPMHQYSGVNDPNCHSSVALALTKTEARVKAIMTLS
jgi:predicted alpha/beta-hydrolase family hydrolase